MGIEGVGGSRCMGGNEDEGDRGAVVEEGGRVVHCGGERVLKLRRSQRSAEGGAKKWPLGGEIP